MNPDDLEHKLRVALEELTRSTPLAHSDAPRQESRYEETDSEERLDQHRHTSWIDGKVLATAACIVLVVIVVATVGLHHQGKRPPHPVASTSTTRPAPTTTSAPTPTTSSSTPTSTTSLPAPSTTAPPTTTAQPPPDFNAAKTAWQQSGTTVAYERPVYWSQAASDLTNAINLGVSGTAGYSTAVADLMQLVSLGGNMLTPPQAAEFAADTAALNAFFGTSGVF